MGYNECMNTNLIIIDIFIIMSFYVTCAYGTTDILRLQKGSDASVGNGKCYCSHCHHEILLRDQIPIFSFLHCHGRCRYCKTPIPNENLIIEASVFFILSAIAIVGSFSIPSFWLCVGAYESIKAIYLIRNGVTSSHFRRELLLSLLNNFFIFLLIGFLFFLRSIVI